MMTPLTLTALLLVSTAQETPSRSATPPAGVRLAQSPLATRRLLLGDQPELRAEPSRPARLVAQINDGPSSTSVYDFNASHEMKLPDINPWIPTAVGGVLLVGGGVCWGLAKGIEGSIRSGKPDFTPEQLDAQVERGRLLEKVGWGVGLTGAAVLGVTAAIVLVRNNTTHQEIPNVVLAPVPVPGGAITSIAGTFPG